MARVMVVDDSFTMRTLVKYILSCDKDLQVVSEAVNGLEALENEKKFHPDIILLDIEMPVMNGFECLERLNLVSSAKVIILSSVARKGSPYALEAQRLGAVELVYKPSGAVSLDLKAKLGHDLVKATRRAAGLP